MKMKHLFVPYEIALLAKEKGFDEHCLAYHSFYKDNNGLFTMCKAGSAKNSVEQVTAPLYQQLVDWFREKHYFLINIIDGNTKNEWWFQVIDLKNNPTVASTIEKDTVYNTYYEALNKALEESFNLI